VFWLWTSRGPPPGFARLGVVYLMAPRCPGCSRAPVRPLDDNRRCLGRGLVGPLALGAPQTIGDPAKMVGDVAPDNPNYQAPAGFLGSPAVSPPTTIAGSPSPARHEGKAAPTLRHTYRLLVWRPVFIANLPLGPAWWGKVIRIVPYQGVHWHMVDLRALR
jgi:hypothetical protein